MAEENKNRTVKDSVFVDLFGRDITARENFISLYNALHGTNLKPEETELVPEMIERVVYMAYANDVAMQVNGRIVVLIEHQSTINNNMPLRLLEYVTRIYEHIVPARKKFYRSMVKIPMPEFYVLYNGIDEFPESGEMRLSDAFMYPDDRKPEELPLELVVKVYNINIGKGDSLLGKCEALRQYSRLVELVREARKEGLEEPLTWAVQEAIKHGVLPDYLKRKSTEVINMLTMEYDYATDVAAQKEESLEEGIRIGREEGREQGLEQGIFQSIRNLILNMKLTPSQAMDALGISPVDQDMYLSKLS